jgi:hypothetical protein
MHPMNSMPDNRRCQNDLKSNRPNNLVIYPKLIKVLILDEESDNNFN